MSLTWRDLLDIFLVGVLLYSLYRILAGTRALNLVRGVLIYLATWFLASLLGLSTLSWILGNAATLGAFALIVVFQPELRGLLERLGRGQGALRPPRWPWRWKSSSSGFAAWPSGATGPSSPWSGAPPWASTRRAARFWTPGFPPGFWRPSSTRAPPARRGGHRAGGEAVRRGVRLPPLRGGHGPRHPAPGRLGPLRGVRRPGHRGERGNGGHPGGRGRLSPPLSSRPCGRA